MSMNVGTETRNACGWDKYCQDICIDCWDKNRTECTRENL